MAWQTPISFLEKPASAVIKILSRFTASSWDPGLSQRDTMPPKPTHSCCLWNLTCNLVSVFKKAPKWLPPGGKLAMWDCNFCVVLNPHMEKIKSHPHALHVFSCIKWNTYKVWHYLTFIKFVTSSKSYYYSSEKLHTGAFWAHVRLDVPNTHIVCYWI